MGVISDLYWSSLEESPLVNQEEVEEVEDQGTESTEEAE